MGEWRKVPAIETSGGDGRVDGQGQLETLVTGGGKCTLVKGQGSEHYMIFAILSNFVIVYPTVIQ